MTHIPQPPPLVDLSGFTVAELLQMSEEQAALDEAIRRHIAAAEESGNSGETESDEDAAKKGVSRFNSAL